MRSANREGVRRADRDRHDQGIPTETTNYTVIINNINNTNPER